MSKLSPQPLSSLSNCPLATFQAWGCTYLHEDLSWKWALPFRLGVLGFQVGGKWSLGVRPSKVTLPLGPFLCLLHGERCGHRKARSCCLDLRVVVILIVF